MCSLCHQENWFVDLKYEPQLYFIIPKYIPYIDNMIHGKNFKTISFHISTWLPFGRWVREFSFDRRIIQIEKQLNKTEIVFSWMSSFMSSYIIDDLEVFRFRRFDLSDVKLRAYQLTNSIMTDSVLKSVRCYRLTATPICFLILAIKIKTSIKKQILYYII